MDAARYVLDVFVLSVLSHLFIPPSGLRLSLSLSLVRVTTIVSMLKFATQTTTAKHVRAGLPSLLLLAASTWPASRKVVRGGTGLGGAMPLKRLTLLPPKATQRPLAACGVIVGTASWSVRMGRLT
jgi:hypothetical protein